MATQSFFIVISVAICVIACDAFEDASKTSKEECNETKSPVNILGLLRNGRVRREASPGQYDALYNNFVNNLIKYNYSSYNSAKTPVIHGFYGDHIVTNKTQYNFQGTSTNKTEYTIINIGGLRKNSSRLTNAPGLNLYNTGLRRRHRNLTRIVPGCIICVNTGCPTDYRVMGPYCVPKEPSYDYEE